MNDQIKTADSSIPKYFSRILDLISDGVYISDRQGRTLKINSMYERLSGLKKEQLQGRNVDYLVSEGIFDTILNPEIVKTGKPATCLQTDSKGKKLVLNGYPIFDDSGDVALVVTFVRDITLLSQLREQIRSQRKLVEKFKTNIQYINEGGDHQRLLIAHSPVMVDLKRSLENLSATDANILLQGETGVGKDVFARKIHQISTRSGNPFIKVDCPTIPESLFESELFGYAPGAFSGAHTKGKLGFFEMAEKGTLFLDEIGELPMAVQAKLLRVLQDREIVRVGSTKLRKVDVRIVSATNRDLEEEVRQGRFRSDLFYRLRVAVITIPPLRDRHEDVVPLAQYFLERYGSRYKKSIIFDDDTLEVFSQYDWPGNIREMENLVQSLVITKQSGNIRISDLPSNMVGLFADSCRDMSNPPTENMGNTATTLEFPGLNRELEAGDRSLKSIMSDIERQILNFALKKHGTHSKVAERFKVDRSTLFRKLRADRSK